MEPKCHIRRRLLAGLLLVVLATPTLTAAGGAGRCVEERGKAAKPAAGGHLIGCWGLSPHGGASGPLQLHSYCATNITILHAGRVVVKAVPATHSTAAAMQVRIRRALACRWVQGAAYLLLQPHGGRVHSQWSWLVSRSMQGCPLWPQWPQRKSASPETTKRLTCCDAHSC